MPNALADRIDLLESKLALALAYLMDDLGGEWAVHQEQCAGVCKYDCLACTRRREVQTFVATTEQFLARVSTES